MRALAQRGLATAAIALSTGCGGTDLSAPRPGRILLLSMDTARADRVSGYGAVDTTPTLREIAEEGVLFTHFYAASSYTLPSHMSIFTGLDPAEHGVVLDAAELNPQVATLTELLRAEGYRPLGIHEGGYLETRFGFGRGFESYTETQRLAVVDSGLPAILEWMREAGDEPYWLFLHTYAAHYPYGGFGRYRRDHPERGLPGDDRIAKLRQRYAWAHKRRREGLAAPEIPERTRLLCTLYNQLAAVHAELLGCGDNYFRRDFLETRHAASDLAAVARSYEQRIGRIDHALAQIRETLVELGQWEDTLLIVTSDHGEAFFEHGHYQHDYVPFDEVLKVPLVISFPALLRNGDVRRVEGLAWHVDLMPTVLALAGASYPGRLRGIDLTPVLRGRAAIAEDRPVFPAVLRLAHREQRPLRRVVLQGDLKYIEGDEHFGDPEGLLFDLAADPGERENLREARSEAFDRLASLGRSYGRGLDFRTPLHQRTGQPLALEAGELAPLELPEEQRQRLRELGYAD